MRMKWWLCTQQKKKEKDRKKSAFKAFFKATATAVATSKQQGAMQQTRLHQPNSHQPMERHKKLIWNICKGMQSYLFRCYTECKVIYKYIHISTMPCCIVKMKLADEKGQTLYAWNQILKQRYII